jgi:hypothetical protein
MTARFNLTLKKDTMKTLIMIASILLITIQLNAQHSTQTQRPLDQLSIGVGGGLDYGGFGGNLCFYPVKSAGVFAGAGYALGGVGLNLGVKYRYIPDKPGARIHPYAVGMYGYNAAIAVLNVSNFNKLFYGPSLGAGIDLHPKSLKIGYWSFGILVPIRSTDVNEYMEMLERDHGADFQNELFPIGFTVGYKFMILKRL